MHRMQNPHRYMRIELYTLYITPEEGTGTIDYIHVPCTQTGFWYILDSVI